MARIGIRELRQHASRYLELVKAGQTVEVTDRGRLVALLTPPSEGAGHRDRLIRAGVLRPSSRHRVLRPAEDLPVPKVATQVVLDELRGES
jgi:prevent-host-death family protein